MNKDFQGFIRNILTGVAVIWVLTALIIVLHRILS
ncbi:hypothetical protein N825_26995 [Skermanella stibiiresistens SB22]|uniref:Uncharacterized protein n=1 Tax=Skermanella stibiiresistens SB22 TaxID=1385369 RepID=W9GUP8_9PROT|nr:hypothetical protein N825_26995 [Skermanella stibiiresistens SB22]